MTAIKLIPPFFYKRITAVKFSYNYLNTTKMKKKSDASKSITPNLANLPLTEYWKQLPAAKRKVKSAPKDDLINVVSEATCRHPETCRKWFLGVFTPPPLAQEKIAQILSCDVECLIED